MKYYLVIAGYNYYPGAGTDDWIGIFPTLSEAQDAEIKAYKNGREWVEIVDLKEWIFQEKRKQ